MTAKLAKNKTSTISNRKLKQAIEFVPAKLILKTGQILDGFAPAQQAETTGEIIFNTGMVGYIESLTDPSYAGQILAFTYPLIGNYGVADKSTWESAKIQVRGVIMSELAPHLSHHAAQDSLLDGLLAEKIPMLVGVDTRELTKILRTQGSTPGIITTQAKPKLIFEDINKLHLVAQVSPTKIQHYGKGKKTIIAVDCGMKENIVRCLEKLPVNIKRVPFDYDYSKEKFDGVFLSNGPGDPARCKETIAILQKVMRAKKPIFGICLGTQLMALAIGAKTYKMRFGHRGQNQPCLHIASNRAYLTSQNHGYAIDEKSLPKNWQVSFRNLNDQTVAGIEHNTLPFFSVQFHPEAAPGPVDTFWLFEKFYKTL